MAAAAQLARSNHCCSYCTARGGAPRPVDPATYVNYGEEDLASEEAMWALYERWCVFFGVKRARDDMLRRFSGFKNRARRIHEFNHSGASYTRALTEMADYTDEERVKYFGSLGRGPCPESNVID